MRPVFLQIVEVAPFLDFGPEHEVLVDPQQYPLFLDILIGFNRDNDDHSIGSKGAPDEEPGDG